MDNEEGVWQPLLGEELRAFKRRARNRWGTYGRTTMLRRHLNRNIPYQWRRRQR